MTPRDELKRKLRDKIKSKRNDSTVDMAKAVRNDPQTAFLRMGLDDPQLLMQAQEIVKNPSSILSKLKIDDAEVQEGLPPPLI